MTTLNVRWEPAEGRVKEYKVVYTPAAGGAEMVVGPGGHLSSQRTSSPYCFCCSFEAANLCCFKQEKVSAGTSSTILRSLQPDTVYTVSLVPVYADGDGKTVSENGKTSEMALTQCFSLWSFKRVFDECPSSGPLAGVKNLRVTDPTMTSLAVNWDVADGAVRLYKVFYVPISGGLEEMVRTLDSCLRRKHGDTISPALPFPCCLQEQVPTGTTSIILRNLSPDTPYRVSVLPVYPAREGKRQSETGRTRELTCWTLNGTINTVADLW